MNFPKAIKRSAIVVVCCFVAWVCYIWPRSHDLPEGYKYIYFPRGGHRYIVAPEGIKKVGQEVLDYRVDGTIIMGRVRRSLGNPKIDSFRLDLKTHSVAYDPPM